MSTATRTGTLPGAASKVEFAREAVTIATDQLIEQLESGKSANLVNYLSTMARFHKYSFQNLMLIMSQRPDAVRVAGFQKWKSMGRSVKKGEKGIIIIAPMIFKDQDAKKNPDVPSNDDPIVRFRAVHVFDLSQTEGDPLPKPDSVNGDPGVYLHSLESAIGNAGIKLETVETLFGAMGVSTGGTIKVLKRLNPAKRFSTLVHEFAHEMLHKKSHGPRLSKTIRETEAEAVAFVVCHSIGLDGGASSSDYIQLYDGNKETLMASLDRIQKTACTIIDAINDPDGSDGNGSPCPTGNDNTPNTPMPPATKAEIEVHELEPDRFAPGEFCYRKERTVGEGDVVSSYSADKIAFTNTIRKPFTWKGQRWIMTSNKGVAIEAYRLVHPEAFPRIPTSYEKRAHEDGGEIARHDPNGFYDGMTVTSGKQTYILCGPPVRLVPGKSAQTSLFDDGDTEPAHSAAAHAREFAHQR